MHVAFLTCKQQYSKGVNRNKNIHLRTKKKSMILSVTQIALFQLNALQ